MAGNTFVYWYTAELTVSIVAETETFSGKKN